MQKIGQIDEKVSGLSARVQNLEQNKSSVPSVKAVLPDEAVTAPMPKIYGVFGEELPGNDNQKTGEKNFG